MKMDVSGSPVRWAQPMELQGLGMVQVPLFVEGLVLSLHQHSAQPPSAQVPAKTQLSRCMLRGLAQGLA